MLIVVTIKASIYMRLHAWFYKCISCRNGFCLMLGAINKDNVILRNSKKDGRMVRWSGVGTMIINSISGKVLKQDSDHERYRSPYTHHFSVWAHHGHIYTEYSLSRDGVPNLMPEIYKCMHKSSSFPNIFFCPYCPSTSLLIPHPPQSWMASVVMNSTAKQDSDPERYTGTSYTSPSPSPTCAPFEIP